MKHTASVALLAGITSLSAFARAQDKDADAERLFREGQKLMEERRFGEACPKFEAAYKKDLQLGTLLNLAYCHKEQGAVWLAWVEFREAELKAIELKRTDRRDFARQRLAELEKLLAKVVVDPPSNPRVELTEVLVEDRRVPEGEKGSPFAAEIGQRKFTFRAKGKKQATLLVNVVKASTPMKVAVPEMEDAPKDAPEPAAGATGDAPAVPPTKDKKGENQKVLALVAGGVGVVGLGVGTIFGLQTFSNKCTDTSENPPCTEDEESRGKTSGMISNIGFAVGIVGLAAGAYLWFTAPKTTTTTGRRPRENGTASARSLRVVPEIGAGWASVRGTF